MRFDGKKPIEFTDDTTELEADALEETKYKLKIPNSSPEPSGDDFDLGGDEDLDLGGEEMGDDLDMGGEELGGEPSSDKPFDDEPFDADVEASEEDDPEKYIQQLAGKLGQTMRTHTEDRGEPDFDLEKFAINSVISASHSAEMDEEDQDDIISKVKKSGMGVDSDDGGEELDMDSDELENDVEPELDLGDDGGEELDMGEEGLDETFDDAERGIEVRALYFKKITSILDNATNMDELGRAVNYINDNVELSVKERIALSNFHDIKMREFGGNLNIPENNGIFAETNLREMTEPAVAPPKEKEKEVERETRRKKTWKKPSTTPEPKFDAEGGERELITGDEE